MSTLSESPPTSQGLLGHTLVYRFHADVEAGHEFIEEQDTRGSSFGLDDDAEFHPGGRGHHAGRTQELLLDIRAPRLAEEYRDNGRCVDDDHSGSP